jgi:hypothetical protein
MVEEFFRAADWVVGLRDALEQGLGDRRRASGLGGGFATEKDG